MCDGMTMTTIARSAPSVLGGILGVSGLYSLGQMYTVFHRLMEALSVAIG